MVYCANAISCLRLKCKTACGNCMSKPSLFHNCLTHVTITSSWHQRISLELAFNVLKQVFYEFLSWNNQTSHFCAKLHPPEINHDISNQEGLAIKWALWKWGYVLEEAFFLSVFTNHININTSKMDFLFSVCYLVQDARTLNLMLFVNKKTAQTLQHHESMSMPSR